MKKNLSLIFSLMFFVAAVAIAQVSEEAVAVTPLTSVEFTENTFEWGELIDGEIIQNVFTFTNTGTAPLIISNAKGSCGCTVPKWPKEAIMPGESSEILVQFNSKGKGKVEGANQSKRVSLTANTSPANIYLTIKGKVFKPENDKEKEAVIANRSDDFDIKSESVLIYPNPTNGELNVNLEAFSGNKALIEIFNLEGKRITSKSIDEVNEQAILFDVSQYPSGTYTTSIKLDGKNRIAKQFVVPAR